MIRPVQWNVTNPSFKGFVNLTNSNKVINTNIIKAVEPTINKDYSYVAVRYNKYDVGLFNNAGYYVKGDYKSVANKIAEADKTNTVIDIEG